MDGGFDQFVSSIIAPMVQQTISHAPPQPQQVDTVVVQLTQEGLTISCVDGFLITLPPKVAAAVKAFFEQMKAQGESNG